MARNYRVRTSPGMSLFAGIIGIVFIGIGIFVAIPHAGLFGIFWTLVATGITVAHLYNAFSSRGVANEIIEVSDDSSGLESSTPESRLRTLENLRNKGLITTVEYDKRRAEILRQI